MLLSAEYSGFRTTVGAVVYSSGRVNLTGISDSLGVLLEITSRGALTFFLRRVLNTSVPDAQTILGLPGRFDAKFLPH